MFEDDDALVSSFSSTWWPAGTVYDVIGTEIPTMTHVVEPFCQLTLVLIALAISAYAPVDGLKSRTYAAIAPLPATKFCVPLHNVTNAVPEIVVAVVSAGERQAA